MRSLKIIMLSILTQTIFFGAYGMEEEEGRPTKRRRIEPRDIFTALDNAIRNNDLKQFDENLEELDAGDLDMEELKTLANTAHEFGRMELAEDIEWQQKRLAIKITKDLLVELIQRGNLDEARKIIQENGVNYNYADDAYQTETALALAANAHQSELIYWLIGNGATLEKSNIWQYATERQDTKLMGYLLENGYDVTYLLSCDRAMLEHLIMYGIPLPSAQNCVIARQLNADLREKDGMPLETSTWFLSHGMYNYKPNIEYVETKQGFKKINEDAIINRVIDKLFRTHSPISYIVSVIVPPPRKINITTSKKFIQEKLSLLSKESTDELSKQHILSDVNNALIMAAGQNSPFLETILQHPTLLTSDHVIKALVAAGINNHKRVFITLLNYYVIPQDTLKNVTNQLLRPLIIGGKIDIIETLLDLALRKRINVDTDTPRKILDNLLRSHISDERRRTYRAVKRIIAEYIAKRNYIQALKRIEGGRASKLIMRGQRLYYTLPRFGQELIPMLPSELLVVIMSYVLSRYGLEK